jgi:hypothetical protein
MPAPISVIFLPKEWLATRYSFLTARLLAAGVVQFWQNPHCLKNTVSPHGSPGA